MPGLYLEVNYKPEMVKKVLILFVVLILALPTIQWNFHPISSLELKGYFLPSEIAKFSAENWFDGIYQQQLSKNIEDSVGFRSDFVRLYTQLDFSLFGLSHANSIGIGKSHYLFYLEGIDNYTGKNRLPPGFIEARVKQYRKLQTYLLEKYGIHFLLIITPDKAQFYPEYIPDRFLRNSKGPVNYSSYIRELDKTGAQYIDFNQYFLAMKDTSSLELYPKNGSHWSSLGALYAFDSLSRYLAQKHGINIPVRVVDTILITNELRGNDGDLSRTMNLIWEPPHPAMSYADYHFSEPEGTVKPRALFVGDSFYWQWKDPFVIDNTFEAPYFWYYSTTLYPDSRKIYTSTFDLDFREHVLNQEIIILIQSMAGSCHLGYGFLERACAELFYPEMIAEYEDVIRTNPEWLKNIEEKAKSLGEPVARVIYREAVYFVNRKVENQK